MTWADIEWVKKHAPGLPVLIKGLGSVEDVALAKKYGARGVFLSNHGVSRSRRHAAFETLTDSILRPDN